MACKYPTSYYLIPSSYLTDPTFNRLHLVNTASVATADVIFLTYDSFGWVNDSLVEASLALH